MKTKTLIIGATVIIIVLLLYFIVPWCILWIGLWLEPAPEKPMYTYKEFPFELLYEINGEVKEINDVMICEYKGIEISENSGKKRKWNSQISNNDTNRILLLKINDLEEIYYNPGPAAFYMGDYNSEAQNDFPSVRYLKRNENNTGYQDGIISEDELYNKYKIKLLNWEIAPPINNTFK